MCEKTLECGKHKCDRDCHEGPCSPCQLSVSRVSRCPCGKKLLTDLEENVDRKECTDPVPTCGAICGKKLKCGKPGSFHTCKSKCHEGPCPPCPLKTPVKCRCGSMDQNVPCVKLTAKADEVTCERQCRKYRFCGKHKCGQKCCINIDHPCPLKCNRLLSCGKHRCQDNCHRGNCERCWEASYEELTCHCGSSTIDPPVPCGTRPPACNLPCLRPQACQHPVTHMCHPEETCPPCTMLMQALCFGGHKTMKSTPCHLRAISCGDLCNRPLKCGSHKCNRVCHEGPCVPPKGKSQCPQKCMTPRACGHPCNGPCHSGPCPTISCKEKVTVTCKCGNLSTVMSCGENEKEFRALAAAKLATQLQHASNAGSSVDLGPINSKDFFKRLDCNDSCASKERANRLAVALQIENPESRGSLGTSSNPAVYSDFLKEEVRKDDQFAKMVHDALTDLVIKARDVSTLNLIFFFYYYYYFFFF